MTLEHTIESLLTEKFREPDFADCFVIEIKLLPHNKLEVFLDSDSGITFEKCHKISRYLESYLDSTLVLGEQYELEVSSAGIGRPLRFARQYVKNKGRKLEITLKDKTKKEGTLLEVADNGIVLEEKVRQQEGKKTKTVVVQTSIPFDDIQKAIVKVTF